MPGGWFGRRGRSEDAPRGALDYVPSQQFHSNAVRLLVYLPCYRLVTFAAALVVTLAAGFLMIRCNRSASSRYLLSSLFCERK